jgi:hypothetical protein
MPFKSFSNCERYSLNCRIDIFSNNKKFKGYLNLDQTVLFQVSQNLNLNQILHKYLRQYC